MSTGIFATVDRQRGHLFPWLPVFLGVGIGVYFVLPVEPSRAEWGMLGAGCLACLVRLGRQPAARPLTLALAMALAGALLAGARTQIVAAPVLGFRYYGAVEGRVAAVDRSSSDAVRLTLDRVRLDDVPPGRTPRRVRISLHDADVWRPAEAGAVAERVAEAAARAPPGAPDPFEILPGARVMTTAHLSPPGGPVEPGGFDFRRHAWFLGLGAVGYTRVPVLRAGAPDDAYLVARARMRLSAAVRAALPGPRGAVAAAITTGDRSAIPAGVLADLRAANLAHLLAISGLHMGLLTGFVFGVLRLGLACSPRLALTAPIRAWAAAGGLAAGAVYLGLSGGNVATERAFVMAAVLFGAMILGRRGLTLRAVAVAALIVLILRPESLTGPGFQMSFAATVALVAAFAALRGQAWAGGARWRRWILGLVMSSAVAGAATAPVGAAHFNQIAHYGLIANLLSVPVMAALVMPAAVLAAVLVPVGLEDIGLHLMGVGLGWILQVAESVAARDGALSHVWRPGPAVLPLMAIGGVWLCLWVGWGRLAGLVPMGIACILWAGSSRPDLLVSERGGLVGVRTKAGLALSKPQGEGFVARVWLENDGDPVPQELAAARPGFDGPRGTARVSLGAVDAVHLTGRGAADRVADACETAEIVILSVEAEDRPEGCDLIDAKVLQHRGAMAIYVDAGKLRRVWAAERAGARPWSAR
ncbi:ComEC/Rec2 family competence protein [Mesobaculum littorinae]|uniref:ComEC/Rec2 family competence protein n=1 Tax=Mesobaculum littorinae TaxID=2486419 RepID=A0A438AMB1_9RHOB|nr:ComEC/Rec2 family competence protein [Mesobaculum littorinae]